MATQTLKHFNYKKGDASANFSFDIEKDTHKKDIEDFIEILNEAHTELTNYLSQLD